MADRTRNALAWAISFLSAPMCWIGLHGSRPYLALWQLVFWVSPDSSWAPPGWGEWPHA